MISEEISRFLRNEIEPIEDSNFGKLYRASATLKDGTFLPCVLFGNAEKYLHLALRRFDESKKVNINDLYMNYPAIVKYFISSTNIIEFDSIAKVENSIYAIPLARLREIRGETSMSLTIFTAIMADGKEFSFRTSFSTYFFEMPDGYSGDQIISIYPNTRNEANKYFKDRLFFNCYSDWIF